MDSSSRAYCANNNNGLSPVEGTYIQGGDDVGSDPPIGVFFNTVLSINVLQGNIEKKIVCYNCLIKGRYFKLKLFERYMLTTRKTKKI